MTVPHPDLDTTVGPYASLYRAIQDRMRPGGDLGADSAHQTMARHFGNGTWTPERISAHRRILTDMRDRHAHKPRDGRAVLLTAGPPGAGKTSALALLGQLRDQDTPLAGQLAAAHIRVADYVTVDPDQFKRALLTDPATRPRLPDDALHLPGGNRLAPAEMATIVHAESRHLANQFALWAREHGYNLLYDTSLRTLTGHHTLLADLAARGYTHRTVVSVEAPLHTALAGNATRWRDGRHAYDTGTDAYGGRMVPEHYIRDLYPAGPTEDSTSRANARRLAADSAVTDLVELDRHRDPTGEPDARPGTSTHRMADTTIHIRTRRTDQAMRAENTTRNPANMDVAGLLRDARQRAADTEHAARTTDLTGNPVATPATLDLAHPRDVALDASDHLGDHLVLDRDASAEIT